MTDKANDIPYTLHRADCLEFMPTLPENSFDSIISDPPYGLSFMGKSWDHGIPGAPYWKEALRIAKPGAHLVAFGGTRTYHRLMCAIEDAGWEIRDCIMWVYASGFPKSMDVSKAIDREAGVEREIIGVKPGHEEFVGRKTSGHLTALKDTGGGGFARPWMDDEEKREMYHMETAPATEDAKKWSGWGTALKPAWEPIIIARKPFNGTVAQNVLVHGTGAINIDASRVLTGEETGREPPEYVANNQNAVFGKGMGGGAWENTKGRWPANLIHDGSDEVLSLFPETQSGQAVIGTGGGSNRGTCYSGETTGKITSCYADKGNASRFFYCAKASKQDRDQGCEHMETRNNAEREGRQTVNNSKISLNGSGQPINGTGVRNKPKNHHPTVKPTKLMQYLCNMFTPQGGHILDPFMGSGSTGKAAVLDGFMFTGIDKDSDEDGNPLGYIEIAEARLENALKNMNTFNTRPVKNQIKRQTVKEEPEKAKERTVFD